MKGTIISYNGESVPVDQYQDAHNLDYDKLSENFSLTESKIGIPDFVYAQPLIDLVQRTRELKASPIIINSGYRTEEKQKYLIEHGYKAAKTSPHCVGMAFDLHVKSKYDAIMLINLIRQASKELSIKIRLGFVTYDYGFVHVDVCPMYYAKGAPFNKEKHPVQWEYEITW